MSSVSNNGSHIQDGTAAGMFEFLDYLVAKGYAPTSTAGPWKSASKQVIATVENTEAIDDVDVRGLDVSDYLQRYETLARGSLKEESIQAYRRRFTSAVEAYLGFIQAGKLPTIRSGSTSRRTRSADGAAAPKDAAPASVPTSDTAHGVERMIEYPFPLRNGQVGMVRLPMRFEKEDAERLAAFVRTLVFEQPKQITAGQPAEASEQ